MKLLTSINDMLRMLQGPKGGDGEGVPECGVDMGGGERGGGEWEGEVTAQIGG